MKRWDSSRDCVVVASDEDVKRHFQMVIEKCLEVESRIFHFKCNLKYFVWLSRPSSSWLHQGWDLPDQLWEIVAFYDRMITAVDKERARGVIYLDRCTAFDTVLHNILSLNWRRIWLVDCTVEELCGWSHPEDSSQDFRVPMDSSVSPGNLDLQVDLPRCILK